MSKYPMVGDNMRMVDMRAIVEAMALLLYEESGFATAWDDLPERVRVDYRERVIEALLPVAGGWSAL